MKREKNCLGFAKDKTFYCKNNDIDCFNCYLHLDNYFTMYMNEMESLMTDNGFLFPEFIL